MSNCNDLKPCRDLTSKKIEIYIQFADSVEKIMHELKFGLESCKKSRDFDLLDIRKTIVDWQDLNDDFSKSTITHGFGRMFFEDPRDNNFILTSSGVNALSPIPLGNTNSRPLFKNWDDEQWWGDQGLTSECVAYAWIHWLEDGPTYQKPIPNPILNPNTVYKQAQLVDEWPGENYNGTSIRAGAKVLQSLGYISRYNWITNVNVLASTVLNLGPVVCGTWWYAGMMTPNRRTGLITTSGRRLGGHAFVITGVDTRTRLFRIKNSWGRHWGINGRAFISYTDMAKLISQQGEICFATEIAKP